MRERSARAATRVLSGNSSVEGETRETSTHKVHPTETVDDATPGREERRQYAGQHRHHLETSWTEIGLVNVLARAIMLAEEALKNYDK